MSGEEFTAVKDCVMLLCGKKNWTSHASFGQTVEGLEEEWRDLICVLACFVGSERFGSTALGYLTDKYKDIESIPYGLNDSLICKFWSILSPLIRVVPELETLIPLSTDLFPKGDNVKALMILRQPMFYGYARDFVRCRTDLKGMAEDVLNNKDAGLAKWVFPLIAEVDESAVECAVLEHSALNASAISSCLISPTCPKLSWKILVPAMGWILDGRERLNGELCTAFCFHVSTHTRCTSTAQPQDDASVAAICRALLEDAAYAKPAIAMQYDSRPIVLQTMIAHWSLEQVRAKITEAMGHEQCPMWLISMRKPGALPDKFPASIILDAVVCAYFCTMDINNPIFFSVVESMSNIKTASFDEYVLSKLVSIFFASKYPNLFRRLENIMPTVKWLSTLLTTAEANSERSRVQLINDVQTAVTSDTESSGIILNALAVIAGSQSAVTSFNDSLINLFQTVVEHLDCEQIDTRHFMVQALRDFCKAGRPSLLTIVPFLTELTKRERFSCFSLQDAINQITSKIAS